MRGAAVRNRLEAGMDWRLITTGLLLAGFLMFPLQVVRISVAQPAHLWVLAALGLMFVLRDVRISIIEASVFGGFIAFAVIVTFMQGYPRIKELDQLSKFAFFYPAFYFVGRWLGHRTAERRLPIGYMFLFGFLAFQWLTQTLSLPVIYEEISFGQGALHGTFKERNWLAVYFFLLSYLVLLKDKSHWRFVPFLALNVAVMLLSGSKTTFVAAGVVFLLQAKLPLWAKIVPTIVGAMVYMTVLSDEFSEEKLRVKAEEERGLALQVSIELIEENPLGYGFGFVEAYFSNTYIVVRGLGEGANSVFSVPVDLWLIAGPVGFIFWLVVFAGVGISSVIVLAPIAALSLLNPLHQSEMIYFFAGVLISQSHFNWVKSLRSRQRPRQARRYGFGGQSRRPPG